MYKKTILVDLDGVLNNYNGNFDKDFIPEPKENVQDFLEKLSKNYTLCLFTTRNHLLASKWLIKHNLDKYFTEVTNVKIPAFLHLDDKAINFNGDYNKTLNEINNFDVYWKQNKN